jgi:uncharacterized membrane protein (DUF485 family)
MNEAQAFSSYIKWRSGFIIKLALSHFALILVFDALCIYTPGFITASVLGNSAITVGVVYALGIVLSVICSTFYYSQRITQEEMVLSELSITEEEQDQ